MTSTSLPQSFQESRPKYSVRYQSGQTSKTWPYHGAAAKSFLCLCGPAGKLLMQSLVTGISGMQEQARHHRAICIAAHDRLPRRGTLHQTEDNVLVRALEIGEGDSTLQNTKSADWNASEIHQ
ncbi:hypothetical protein BV898_00050 [Hypsibius exemplaris]|uniref:Uncharacterized protein n=1 Tax=Hypsibius exemplaris TaxID=2072580 RepID=A0A1W0XEL3_HYPEX|nr:hypothetical protein BV898_00050 [Hypsibius exemplaris]